MASDAMCGGSIPLRRAGEYGCLQPKMEKSDHLTGIGTGWIFTLFWLLSIFHIYVQTNKPTAGACDYQESRLFGVKSVFFAYNDRSAVLHK